MNNEYMLKDILDTEKSLVANMATALNEASCEKIYNTYLDLFTDIAKEVKTLFSIAYNNSWYKLENAPKTKIETEYNKICKELDK